MNLSFDTTWLSEEIKTKILQTDFEANMCGMKLDYRILGEKIEGNFLSKEN